MAVISRGVVAIIGGGVSGLCMAKHCVAAGLEPIVFEKAATIGGVWGPHPSGKTWKSLRTNLSKWTCNFSDHPWPSDAPLFPSSEEMREYLSNYVDKHSLVRYLRLSCEVQDVLQSQGIWTIKCMDHSSATRSEISANFLVIASGFNAAPVFPDIPGRESFQGNILHSTEYQIPSPEFEGQRVCVIGNSFSGADIAVEIASSALHTFNAVRTPRWILPRKIMPSGFQHPVPFDLCSYSRAAQKEKEKLRSNEERYFETNSRMLGLLGQPGDVHKLLFVPVNDKPRGICISDVYLDAVARGAIDIRPAVKSITSDSVIFLDDTEEKVDVIVCATGLRPALGFMSNTHVSVNQGDDSTSVPLLALVEYDAHDNLLPLVLFLHTIHPLVPNAGFVGMSKGPYFAVIELQCRWLSHIFNRSLSPPTFDVMMEGIVEQRNLRNSSNRPQFPAHYVTMAEQIAEQVGVIPKHIIEDVEHPLHEAIVRGPILGAHYRLGGESCPTADEPGDKRNAVSFEEQVLQVHNFLQQARK